jgi:SAM-dependent methyltransferase
MMNPHGLSDASHWVARWAHLVRPGGAVLDVACGHGRHMKLFAQSGHAVTGIDQSAEALATAAQHGKTVLADIENNPWPLLDQGAPAQFDAVIITNYLWRPLFATLASSVAQGGVLIYETFAVGNETVGKPSRPDFLLKPGELLQAFAHFRVVAFEDGFEVNPKRFVQRLVAVRASPLNPGEKAALPLCLPLHATGEQPPGSG